MLAAEDLERIFRRIEKDNPSAALETVKAIYDGCEALRDFPHLGRPGRMKGRRELVFSPYIAVYQVKEYAVEISRIYHGAQDWP
jgi:addiction module RelE/StbE family toxin